METKANLQFHFIAALSLITSSTSQGADDESTNRDEGLSRHEELVIFACLGAVSAMAITIVLFLWYVVDRTKERIRYFERHLPKLVEKFRSEVADEIERDADRIVMSGTLAASGEFEGVHHPLDVARGRVRLTSYTRKQDVGITTDFPENQAAVASEQAENARTEPNRRTSSKAPDGSDSKDFIFVNGEYIPRDVVTDGKHPPPYAYDNPAYDNPYTDAENGNTKKQSSNGQRNGTSSKGKDKSKLSVYESHV